MVDHFRKTLSLWEMSRYDTKTHEAKRNFRHYVIDIEPNFNFYRLRDLRPAFRKAPGIVRSRPDLHGSLVAEE